MRRIARLPFLALVLVFVPCAASPQGNPLGPAFRVNTYTAKVQDRPAVASDSSGNFVVVWDSRFHYNQSAEVFGQRYASTGEPLGSEFRVNTYTTGHQQREAVASDSSGNFIVVWDSPQDSGGPGIHGIFGQRYGRIVPVELTHFEVE
jgi:hypothetical protein